MTDEDRIQNVAEILAAADAGWIATEKLDGTSMTVWVDLDPASEDRGVCGRNWDLVEADGNTLWQLARQHDLHDLLATTWPGTRTAIQGEAFGEGIQGNPLKLRGHHFALFTIRVDGAELPRSQWPDWALDLSVPVRDELAFPGTVEEALADVDGLMSSLAPGRPAEGVVWRARGVAMVTLPDGSITRASFKVISNRYLLKHDH